MGWTGLSNGILLQKAQQDFDIFLTGDTNLSFQQTVTSLIMGVIILEARSTRLTETVKLMPQVLKILESIGPGEVVRVSPKIK